MWVLTFSYLSSTYWDLSGNMQDICQSQWESFSQSKFSFWKHFLSLSWRESVCRLFLFRFVFCSCSLPSSLVKMSLSNCFEWVAICNGTVIHRVCLWLSFAVCIFFWTKENRIRFQTAPFLLFCFLNSLIYVKLSVWPLTSERLLSPSIKILALLAQTFVIRDNGSNNGAA